MLDKYVAFILVFTAPVYLATVFLRGPQLFPKTLNDPSPLTTPDHIPRFLVALVAMTWIGFGKVQILGTSIGYIAIGLLALAYWPVIIHAWLQPSQCENNEHMKVTYTDC